jgi:A-kinase anchor protein 1
MGTNFKHMREHQCFFPCDSGHEAVWSKESVAGMEELTQGQVLQAQVCGYAEDGLPVVYLYAMHGSKVRIS